MQTLNVGAGRTDQEHKVAQEQHAADLLAESRSDANFFFWAAGLAALGTGLVPVEVDILVNVGAVDLLTLYGRQIGGIYPALTYSVAVGLLIVLIGLGFAARGGYRWAFLAGMLLYAADMIALIALFSLWAFGIHAFFLLKWYQGQKALVDAKEARIAPA